MTFNFFHGLKVEDNPHLHPGGTFSLEFIKESMHSFLVLVDSGEKHQDKRQKGKLGSLLQNAIWLAANNNRVIFNSICPVFRKMVSTHVPLNIIGFDLVLPLP